MLRFADPIKGHESGPVKNTPVAGPPAYAFTPMGQFG